jgi:hypothetical protein
LVSISTACRCAVVTVCRSPVTTSTWTCDMAGTQRWLAGCEILRTGCCQKSEQWVYVGLMLLSAVTGFYNFRSLFTFILFAGLANMTALCF